MPVMADEPSAEQIWDWFIRLSYDDQTAILINYYRIEHTIPEISLPDYTAILTTENDLIVYPNEEKGSIKIDYLSYEISMPSYYFPKFITEKSPITTYFIIGGCCIVGGFIIGLLIPD